MREILRKFCAESGIQLRELKGTIPKHTIVYFKDYETILVGSDATMEHVREFLLREFGFKGA